MIDATRAPSSDPYLDALRDYERAVAPAYEVIRRARVRLGEAIAALTAVHVDHGAGARLALADPTEPNGAELAVEAALAIKHPERGPALVSSAPVGQAPAPESMPAAASSPPGGEPPAPISYPNDPAAGRPRPGEEDGAKGRRPRAQATTARRPIGSAPTAPGPAIESPGSARSGKVEPGSVGTPTPASHTCVDCGATFAKPQGLGRHRAWRHPEQFTPKGDQRRHHNATKPKSPAPAVDEVTARRRRQAADATPRAAAVKRVGVFYPCPSCKDPFVSEEKLQAHRERSHGLRADGHSESFLCSRCTASFPDRTARDAHQATHPADPSGPTVGRDPYAQRNPAVSGVPIA